jgi:hypothetical protein
MVAEWRAEAPAPSTVDERVRRLDWNCVTLNAMATAGTLGFLGVFQLLWPLHARSSNVGAFMAFGGLAVALIALLLRFRFRAAGSEIGEMMDLPTAVEQFPVRAALYAGKTRYGLDVGVVAFVDHRLHFEGRLMTFDVSRAEVSEALGRLAKFFHSKREISVTSEPENRKVTFYPYDRVLGDSRRYRREFALAFRDWSQTQEGHTGTSLLPPRYPTAKTIRRATWGRLAYPFAYATISFGAQLIVVFGGHVRELDLVVWLVVYVLMLLFLVPLCWFTSRGINHKLLELGKEGKRARRAGVAPPPAS